MVYWELGKACKLIDSGARYDMGFGTSAGALCVAILSQFIGEYGWRVGPARAADFVLEKAGDFKQIAKPRNRFTVCAELAASLTKPTSSWLSFGGLYDMTRLERILSDVLDPVVMKRSQFQVEVCSVDSWKRVRYYNPSSISGSAAASWSKDLAAAMVRASSAIPIFMNHVDHPDLPEPMFDGGLRDYCPIGRSIDIGATHIDAIIAKPKVQERRLGHKFSFRELAAFVVGTAGDEVLENDLAAARRINNNIENVDGSATKYRYVDLIEHRPTSEVDITYGWSRKEAADAFDRGYNE